MAETAVLVSPGAKAFYDRQIQAGKPHNTAIRAVANKLIGPLHACLKNHCLYDEGLAWPQAAVARAA
jgi:hypothetical protein